MKNVGIFAIMQTFDEQFSLSNCIRMQLEVLAEHGYNPKFITLEGFKDNRLRADPRIEIRDIIPQWRLHGVEFFSDKKKDYSLEEKRKLFFAKQDFMKEDVFRKRSEITKERLYDAVHDLDVVISHDIMYIDWNLPYNQAIRWVIKDTQTPKWLHLFHSAPQKIYDQHLGYPLTLMDNIDMPNSRYVSLNYSDRAWFCENYNISHQKHRVLYNVLDIRKYFSFHKKTCEFIDKYCLMDCDIMIVYPTSLQLFKQVNKLIDLAAAFKRAGYKTKLIVVASYSDNQERIIIRETYQKRAANKGLSESEVIFTNRDKDFNIGTPNWFVRELLQISNIFVHPSTSEACSLIMIEAMLTRNFLILNGDFESFVEFGGFDSTFYLQFGSSKWNTTYEHGFDKYCDDAVPRIMAWYDQNHALKTFWRARKMFSKEVGFRKLQQLIEEKWD